VAILESSLDPGDAKFRDRAEHWRAEVARLRAEEAALREGGGAEAQARQRALG
jgi:hypothetical protein